MLAVGYGYLYGQRLTDLFTRCHNVLWAIMAEEGGARIKLRPFRFSSFIWRLFGSETMETRYLNELEQMSIDATLQSSADFRYFVGRSAHEKRNSAQGV